MHPLTVCTSIRLQLVMVWKRLPLTLLPRSIHIRVDLGHNLTVVMIIRSSNVTTLGTEMAVHILVEMVLTITTIGGIRTVEIKIGTLIEILTIETTRCILKEVSLG